MIYNYQTANRNEYCVEVTKKCPASLADCLREFDLVLSRVGAVCVGVEPLLTAIGRGVREDLSRKQGGAGNICCTGIG